MHLESIRLANFKNYEQAQLDFSPQVNCFLGPNGSGKTNLLDAIYYLAITKSSEQSQDQLCIKHEEAFFSVKGLFIKEERREEVLCALELGKKKTIRLDGVPYKKASEHVGKVPVVLIAPNDTDVIRGASDERRKFFDAILSQTDPIYLQHLLKYNHALKQRNSLLKRFAEQQTFDADLLESFTLALITLGTYIYEKRKEALSFFKPLLVDHYQNISDEGEAVDIHYQSQFDQDIKQVFAQSLQKDLVLKRTNVGIHKDDFDFLMEERPIKKFGSQGQQKSFLISLKLANYDFLKEQKGIDPILLLDDIFDKLDDQRIGKLIEMVASDQFGQIFITDARPERSRGFFDSLDIDCHFYEVTDGQVVMN
jgi:DNA replication and repair protein RecF